MSSRSALCGCLGCIVCGECRACGGEGCPDCGAFQGWKPNIPDFYAAVALNFQQRWNSIRGHWFRDKPNKATVEWFFGAIRRGEDLPHRDTPRLEIECDWNLDPATLAACRKAYQANRDLIES